MAIPRFERESAGSGGLRGNTVRVLLYAIFGVLALIFMVILWAAATGLFQRQTPRSFVERQVDMLESVVKEKPKSEEAWADYALALIAAKQYTTAETVLDRADKAVGKDVVDIVLVRAHLAEARGDAGLALELTDKAIKSGLAFRAKEMRRMAEEGLTPDPNVVKGPILGAAYFFRAQLLAEAGKKQEAVEALDRALAEESTSADALVLRGNLHADLSNVESATADFERALAFIPDFQPAIEGMERLGKEAK